MVFTGKDRNFPMAMLSLPEGIPVVKNSPFEILTSRSAATITV